MYLIATHGSFTPSFGSITIYPLLPNLYPPCIHPFLKGPFRSPLYKSGILKEARMYLSLPCRPLIPLIGQHMQRREGELHK